MVSTRTPRAWHTWKKRLDRYSQFLTDKSSCVSECGSAVFQHVHYCHCGDCGMALLVDELDLLYLANPCTASTSVIHALQKTFSTTQLPKANETDAIGNVVDAKHVTAGYLLQHDHLSMETLHRLIVATAIRNPFDLLVSRYCKMKRDRDGLLANKNSWAYFSELLRSLVAAAQFDFNDWFARWVSIRRANSFSFRLLADYVRHANHIIRFENLRQDFNKLMVLLGHDPAIHLPHLQQSRAGNGYRAYYNHRSKDTAIDLLGPEAECFGYEF